MKLHLPKILLTAVLAVYMTGVSAWAGNWGNNGKDGSEGSVYYVSATETTVDSTSGNQAQITELYLSQAVNGNSASGSKAATIETLLLKSGDTMTVQDHPWKTDVVNFSLLTINQLTIGGGTGSAAFNVNAGHGVQIDAVSGSFSSLCVAGTLTLGTNALTNIGAVSVASGGTLDLSSVNLGTDGEAGNDVKLVTLMNKTAGAGKVKLASGTHIQTQDKRTDVNLRANYVVEGDATSSLYLASWAHNNIPQWRIWDVSGGGSLQVGENGNGTLYVLAGQQLGIQADGTVKVGSLILGHDSVANNPGSILMTGGELTVQKILGRNPFGSKANEVTITGGTLNVTGTDAVGVTGNARLNVSIGGTGEDSVILQTEDNDWVLDGSSTNLGGGSLSIGNVTIDVDNTHGITFANAQVSGIIMNNATLTLGEGISIKSGDTVTLSGSSIGISCALTNNGTLVLDGAISATGYDYTGVDDSLVTYSDNGTDGFKVYQTGKEFYLVEGEGNTTITENCSFTFNGLAAEVVSENNKASFVLKEDCTNETIYYVRTKDFTVDGTANNPAANATGYDVASGRTLTIAANQSDSMTASTILSTTTGAGNIALTTAVTMSSAAQATGKLTIENGAVLTMDVGRDTDHTYLSSFSSIDLNGATIKYHGSNTTLNNVTVGEAGADLLIKDMGSDRVITFAGTTTLGGNLSIESRWGDDQTWKYGVNIENLTGSGDLTIKGTTHAESNNEKNKVTAKLLSTYTGAITAERSTNNSSTTSVELTTAGDVSLKGLKLLKGATGKITATGTLGLGDVDLTGGSTLTIMNSGSSRTTTMQSLDVTGTAVVQTERSASCYNGTINIGALNGENATVTFRNGAKTDAVTTFNLDGGSFSGTINVEGNSEYTANVDRPVHLNLNSRTVAEQAVINFRDPSTADNGNRNKITLGVGAAEVKVAGLSGETTNAATVKSTDAAATRTLVINTAENESYTTNAVVDSSVNLHKMGAGTQEFSADMSGYTGSIAVMAGELRFSATELMNVGGVNVGTAGTLTAHATEKTGHISTSGQVELAAGATINGSVTLNKGATLEMTGLDTVDSGITLKGSLVIEDKQTLVTALSSYVKSRSEISSIRIFSGLTGLTVGDYTFSDKNNLVDLSTWDTSGTFTSENTYFITYDSDNGNVDLSMGEMVPEPTTTTLSLLALTALAARRRRKLK